MATTPDLKKHCIDALKIKLQSITHVLRTRNSPRSAYVRDFQFLSQPHTVNIQRDVYKHLDLVTAFDSLTIVTFTDEKSEPQPSTSRQEDQRPFFCASLTPSPTTTEEEAEIPELIDIPIPEEVEQDKISIEDSDWLPPPITYRQVNHKRKNSTQLPDIDEEACTCCGRIKCKSWLGQDEQ